jgi:predicted nuclease of predicted toxin-antitoxin system
LTSYLADENNPLKTVQSLRMKGINIISITETSPGLSDKQVLETANRQNRIIITFDTDFGNLVIRQKLKTKGIILLRFKPKSAQHIADTIVSLLRTRTPTEPLHRGQRIQHSCPANKINTVISEHII